MSLSAVCSFAILAACGGEQVDLRTSEQRAAAQDCSFPLEGDACSFELGDVAEETGRFVREAALLHRAVLEQASAVEAACEDLAVSASADRTALLDDTPRGRLTRSCADASAGLVTALSGTPLTATWPDPTCEDFAWPACVQRDAALEVCTFSAMEVSGASLPDVLREAIGRALPVLATFGRNEAFPAAVSGVSRSGSEMLSRATTEGLGSRDRCWLSAVVPVLVDSAELAQAIVRGSQGVLQSVPMSVR